MIIFFKNIIFLLFYFLYQIVYSQQFNINGIVKTNLNVEGVHAINKTGKFNTVTNKNGEFNITAMLNDTILFLSLQHKTTSIIITSDVAKSKKLVVELNEQINELNEVFVGNTLSGDLQSDLNQIRIDQPIKLSDIGIPVNNLKKLTPSERALYTAGEFKPIMLLDVFLKGRVKIEPILNSISGRTKKLKNRVQLESRTHLIENIKNNLSDVFFRLHKLEKSKRVDFFYFCEESNDFLERCSRKTDVEILTFLEEKLILWKSNFN